MTSVQWLRADWPAPADIVAGTTLRQGGVSAGRYLSLNLAEHVGDDRHSVQTNRRRFHDACGLPAEPLWLSQAHGKVVVPAESAEDVPRADAIVATRADTVCAILTADCLPVLFACDDGTAIAAAHAGWRGLCEGVLEETVAALPGTPSTILAWLGPAISQPAFEVGSEVRERFLAYDDGAAAAFRENDRSRWQADLYQLARLRLCKAGVTRIFGGGRCTFSEPGAFFSYRRDGECGRMATFVFSRKCLK